MTLVLRLWLGLTAMLPWALHWLARRMHRAQGADPNRFAERLGHSLPARGQSPILWFHAASLGEVAQLRDLSHRLAQTLGAEVLVTTTTKAGSDWVARELPEAHHHYAPVDTPDAVTRFLNHWSPMAAIFVESDLWPRLVLATAQRDIPLILVNARASRTRDRLPKSMAALLGRFRLITCRTPEIAKGLQELGLSPGHVVVTGDLKAAADKLPVDAPELARLSASIGTRPVWIAASTHASDEAAVLAAQAELGARPNQPLLIWAPRHPRRAASIRMAAQSRGLAVAQRSSGAPITPSTAIYLADTMGELGTIFSLSRIVYLGGGLGREGGHNPYEPAHFGAAVLSGPKVRNFADAFQELKAAGAVCLVADGEGLAHAVSRLFGGQATEMGENARRYVQAQGHALAATAEHIQAALQRG